MSRILHTILAVMTSVMLFSGCSQSGSTEDWRPTVTQSLHDATTASSVQLALSLEPSLQAIDVDVHTERGTVTLSREVGSEAERQLAVEVAQKVSRVDEVVNEIRVRD